MARGFDTTFGAGASDSINTPALNGQTTYSISAWCWVNSDGGDTAGRILFCNETSTAGFALAMNSSNTGMKLVQGASSGNSLWTWTVPDSVWFHICVVYAGSGTPKVYINGAAVTVGGSGTSGTVQAASSQKHYIGNDNGGAHVWDGMLAEAALWYGQQLTAAEALALSKGLSPLFVRNPALTIYLPLFGAQSNEPDWGPSHYAQTITGTKKQNHAPASFWMPPTPSMPQIAAAPVLSRRRPSLTYRRIAA